MLNFDVSVIIPAKNASSTIDKALASVFSQSGIDKLEVIVIDDGSTDGTAQLIKEDYPSVKLILTGGKGVSAARNAGISYSVGKYVAFLDADDEWKPEKLFRQVSFLEQNPDYIMCSCTAEYVDTTGFFLGAGKKTFDGDGLKALMLGNFIVTSSAVIRYDTVRRDGISFNTRMGFGEDWQFWLRLAARGKIKVLQTPLVKYTCYPGRKYSLEFLTNSMLQMVDTLSNDDFFVERLGADQYMLAAIPDLSKLVWVRQVNGFFSAVSEGYKLLLKYPRLLLSVVRRIL